MSEGPPIPEFVTQELQRRWPGVVLSWEPWPEPDCTVLPVVGLPFRRQVRGGGVQYKYLLPGHEEATDWFQPEAKCVTTHRYVARDLDARRPYRIFDLVFDDGALLPPSQEVLDGLARRYDQWDELNREQDQFEQAAEDPETGEKLNFEQWTQRKEVEDRSRDPMKWFLRKVAGVVDVFMYDPPPKSRGLKVIDRRRFKEALHAGSVDDGTGTDS